MVYHFCIYKQFPTRIDIYLTQLFPEFTRSYIQKIIDRGMVKINHNVVSKNAKIKNADEIYIQIELSPQKVLSQDIPLDIVYEDDAIIIVNKDAGINTHPVPGEFGKIGTLVNAILHHCGDKLPTIGGEERPGIVHRLDKDTSGLIMIAKNDKMMQYLQTLIRKRKIEKYYYAVVNGKVAEKHFKIESYIGRHPNERIKMTTKNPINPKIAISIVERVKYLSDDMTLVKVKIETGRTHQIRVHLSSIGYPIVGDEIYGNTQKNSEILQKYGLKRQALHACELVLDLYGEKKVFSADLKKDMKILLSTSV